MDGCTTEFREDERMIPVLVRSSDNPIITGFDVPAMPPDLVDPTSVFNPGATKFGDRYMLLLRVQSRGRRTFFVVAESKDGRNFDVRKSIVHIEGLDEEAEGIHHVFDPRITRIDDTWYVMFAVDADTMCRVGVARTTDFERFELVGIEQGPDVRNGVLFPTCGSTGRTGFSSPMDRPREMRSSCPSPRISSTGRRSARCFADGRGCGTSGSAPARRRCARDAGGCSCITELPPISRAPVSTRRARQCSTSMIRVA
jgi:hypothetical protein